MKIKLIEITEDNWLEYRADPKWEKFWNYLDRTFGDNICAQ